MAGADGERRLHALLVDKLGSELVEFAVRSHGEAVGSVSLAVACNPDSHYAMAGRLSTCACGGHVILVGTVGVWRAQTVVDGILWVKDAG